MERKYPNLFKPLTIGGVTLRNRIGSAPMAYPDINSDGTLNPEAAAFYEARARGGAAVVTVSECIVESTYGRSHNLNIFMDAPNALPGLAMTAAAIKRHGALACAELNHSGKHSGADNLDKSRNKANKRYGPSAEVLANGSVIEEMTVDWIHGIVEKFAQAAALVKKAGFDMILLHAGHGWLLQQFMSPHDNRRTDEYGGSLANRCRLTLEVLDAIRAQVGPSILIEIRLSADEYMADGYHIEDCIEIARLVESKVDLIQISTGSHEDSFDKTHQPMFVERGGLTHFAAQVKRHVSKPVATIGALSYPGHMEELIARGDADVVYMGRQLLADPDWPRKVMTDREDEIVHCCRCFTCMGERMATGRRICALNPEIGSEYELKFAPSAAETPKRVLVAGGGPGGMTAAISAAKMGHSVILCEASDRLGGALRAERAIDFKQDLFAFVAAKARQMEKAGVEVRLNTPVTPALCDELKPDVLMIAVGAAPIIPPLPGIDRENVIVANDLSEPETRVGQRVVILGGGLVGCESAIHLARDGHQVTVVEMQDTVAPDANGRHRPILLDYLARLVTVRTGMRGLRVTEEGLVCADKDGQEVLFPADTVICSVGQRPRRDVAEALHDGAPEVMEIGDCVKVGTVTQATFRGYFAGRDI